MLKHGAWKLSDLASVPKNGLNVFSCFHCGGGSTMGYKLAGYTVLGGVEIDPKMMSVYQKNHNPKYPFLMGVKQFNQLPIDDLPKELLNLDILDGSPPCSSFSTAGARERKWGEASKFREGQAHQVLDDLFFDFIDTASKLAPKVIVAENVKGMLTGNARGYVKLVFQAFSDAGYDVQLFLLNASRMGVPQRRERVFFIARRRDLNLTPIKLEFNEDVIPFSQIKTEGAIQELKGSVKELWDRRHPSDLHIGEVSKRMGGKVTGFTTKFIHDNRPLYTITAGDSNILFQEPRMLNDSEVIAGQTFPTDYDFDGMKPRYICGMSVPPFMMQRVALQIHEQWLSKLEPIKTKIRKKA